MDNKHEEIDHIIYDIVSYGLTPREYIKGCSSEQIEELKNKNIDVILPEEYIYFMKKAGGEPFWHLGVELSIRPAICAIDIAEEFVEEDPDFDLSQKLFIGNYKFDVVFFFKKGSSAIHSFDGVEEKKVKDSFSSFLRSEVDASKKSLEGAQRLKGTIENRKN